MSRERESRHSLIARTQRRSAVTLLWFFVWIISNAVGDKEPLLTDPVNVWTWTLILAVAVDLAGLHGNLGKRGGSRQSG
jgi:hypothetical protein